MMVRSMRMELGVTKALSSTVKRVSITMKETLSGLRLESEDPGDLLTTMGTTEGRVRAHDSKLQVEKMCEMALQMWELRLKSHITGSAQSNQ
uniref:Uncharacterized protein n=1 Tax=Brassica campestris TaxID=3711 RepID=A0A3P5Z824_BRACM|nr:unnamed protein product [Brassica rapa]